MTFTEVAHQMPESAVNVRFWDLGKVQFYLCTDCVTGVRW